MKFTRYGKDVILKVFILGLVLTILSLFIDNNIVKFLFTGITIFLWLFTLYFFRDPDRSLPNGYKDDQLISPADGKVVVIEDVINKEDNLFKKDEPLKQISIFLSPLNVHVNRNPINGKVTYLKYIEGEYLVAFDHKSSERNERTEIGIENPENGCKVLFKQIAGFVARRIVYDLKIGCTVTAGDRFGMIKFGSRVDILVKRDSKVLVTMDQKVIGGETIIAEL
ncbi:MAG: phosphatidylserine decarboxylase family protein [Ignavibacteria bacterium]